jgi:hypothetical protein
MMLTAVRRLCGQRATGPSRVADQSKERISAPISPPPARQSARADLDAVIMSSTLENAHSDRSLQAADPPAVPGTPRRNPLTRRRARARAASDKF